MAKRSIFSFLKDPFSSRNVTTFFELDVSEERQTQDETIDDMSQIDIGDSELVTPGLYLETEGKIQVPLLAVGGAGIRILNQVIKRVESYGLQLQSMAFDTEKEMLESYDSISHKMHIPGSDLGTGQQYRVGASRIQKVNTLVKEELTEYLNSLNLTYRHEFVFILMGSGGTGVGAGIELARMLVDMGKRPVPFLVLPDENEISRIKFNAAVALYYFSYAPKNRCLNLTTICIDNAAFLNSNSKNSYPRVISASNEKIGTTLADLLASTVVESHGYSADLNEFLEIFRDLKGIGVLQYLQVEQPSTKIFEVFENYHEAMLSLKMDIYSATRGYFYISAKEKALIATDYRSLMSKFQNADIFNKLHEINRENTFYAFRGIYTGFSYPDRIEKLMNLAESARITVLNKEIEQKNRGRPNAKIDQLQDDEEIDVKTGDELVEDRAKEHAKLREEGDLS